MKNSPELNKFQKDSRLCFDILKKLSKKDLFHLGYCSGLDMGFYKTKRLVILGLMTNSGIMLPRDSKNWK